MEIFVRLKKYCIVKESSTTLKQSIILHLDGIWNIQPMNIVKIRKITMKISTFK
jgi:hypothetical protein